MKTSNILGVVALAASAFTAPTEFDTTSLEERSQGNFKFNGLAQHTGTIIQNTAIVARNNALWLTGETKTFCPNIKGIKCPGGKHPQAGFVSGHGDVVDMNTAVPGGQRLYVAKDGSVGYTIAHSGAIPEGASENAFSYKAGVLSPKGKTTFFGCKVKGGRKVFTRRVNNKCIWFTFTAEKIGKNKISAYQYA